MYKYHPSRPQALLLTVGMHPPARSQALDPVSDFDNSSYAIGYLRLTITQGAYSWTELTDIDPFDPAALLGNIGGFWGRFTPCAVRLYSRLGDK